MDDLYKGTELTLNRWTTAKMRNFSVFFYCKAALKQKSTISKGDLTW